MTTTAQLEGTIEALVPLTKLLWRERDALTDQARVIINEVSCLLDVLSGVYVTNPEERARLHIETLDQLVHELPTVGVRTDHPQGTAG